jgi:hypothetical protein
MSLDHACTLEWSYRVSFFLESVYKLPHCKMFHIFISRCPLHCITIVSLVGYTLYRCLVCFLSDTLCQLSPFKMFSIFMSQRRRHSYMLVIT